MSGIMDNLSRLLTVLNSFKTRMKLKFNSNDRVILNYEKNETRLSQENYTKLRDFLDQNKDSYVSIYCQFSKDESLSIGQRRAIEALTYTKMHHPNVEDGVRIYLGDPQIIVIVPR